MGRKGEQGGKEGEEGREREREREGGGEGEGKGKGRESRKGRRERKRERGGGRERVYDLSGVRGRKEGKGRCGWSQRNTTSYIYTFLGNGA